MSKDTIAKIVFLAIAALSTFSGAVIGANTEYYVLSTLNIINGIVMVTLAFVASDGEDYD